MRTYTILTNKMTNGSITTLTFDINGRTMVVTVDKACGSINIDGIQIDRDIQIDNTVRRVKDRGFKYALMHIYQNGRNEFQSYYKLLSAEEKKKLDDRLDRIESELLDDVRKNLPSLDPMIQREIKTMLK